MSNRYPTKIYDIDIQQRLRFPRFIKTPMKHFREELFAQWKRGDLSSHGQLNPNIMSNTKKRVRYSISASSHNCPEKPFPKKSRYR